MRRSLITASALIAVLTLALATLAQQDDSPAPETTPAKPATKSPANTVNAGDTVPAANPVPKDTTPAGPIIIAPKSSREGRTLFDQKRYAEAKPWLEKACNLGNTDSCGLHADFYYYGYGGVSQDYEQARLLDKQACDGGNKDSCGKPRLLYEKGLGVATNYVEARALYKNACSGGSMARCSAPGMLYLNSQAALETTNRQALSSARPATAHSCSVAPRSARSIRMDRAHSPTLHKARVFYEEACNGGEIVGRSWLARLYQAGLGGPQDYSQARSLFKKACDGGFRPACDQPPAAILHGDRSVVSEVKTTA